MLLYFVRHGDPCYDPESLTPLGLRQAEAIGRRIARYGVDRIFSSPMKRAQQTAQPAAEMLTKEIELLDFASEQHAWDGLTYRLEGEGDRRKWCSMDEKTQQLFASEEVRALGMKWYEHPAFDGTTFGAYMQKMGSQCDEWMASLGYEHTAQPGIYKAIRENKDRVALFAHAGFGGAFFSHLLGIPYPQYSQTFDLAHSSLTLVEFEERHGVCVPRVMTLSNDAHLYHENLPVRDRDRF